MTGLFIRVLRNGKWQNIEFEHLTDAEMDNHILRQPVDMGWAYAKALAKWIKENVKEQEPEPVIDSRFLDRH